MNFFESEKTSVQVSAVPKLTVAVLKGVAVKRGSVVVITLARSEFTSVNLMKNFRIDSVLSI